MFSAKSYISIFCIFLSSSVYSGSSNNHVPSISLKPMSSDSNKGKVSVSPLKGAFGVIELSGLDRAASYFVVRYIKRGVNGYHLVSVDDKKIILTKSNSTIKVKGSDKYVFELYLPNKKTMKLTAIDETDNLVSKRFYKNEFPAIVNWKERLKNLNKNCNAKISIQWEKGLTSKLKNRSVHFLNAMSSLCQFDIDYKEEILKIKSIDFVYEAKDRLKIDIKNNKVKVKISGADYVLESSARHILLNSL